MENNFPRALKFVFEAEGGYVNDPNDPGGETKYGISKRSHPKLDIKNLTKEIAGDIYYKEYWIPAGCKTLPFPFDFLLFDASVQHGVGRATQWLGKAKTGKDYLFVRLEFYSKCKDFNHFGRGWINRLLRLHRLIERIKLGD